ncbi:potassium channel subfamily K member 15-like [Orbicella faveolata]|uniref:potassium channel subfamily K member 15-like n=1 Tax=Orbicella faveolata TaxID=48498 RepID=UPI0009E4653A|nr:potassium channel subfamily K member 15-like [Orbicella faveolata]
MFYYLERKPEKNKEVYFRLSRELQQNFTAQYNTSINESDFKRFMQKAFEVVRVGNKPDWSILSGLSFSMTTLATVGYGHITPETPLGQLLTVLYCFVGLPISMLTLKTFGELLSKMVNNFIHMLETKVLGGRRPRRVKMKSFFTILTLMVLTLCAFGLKQSYMEGWTFIEGVYAWFVTLSTIGYGDYVPNWGLLLRCEESLHSKITLGLVISASALPAMVALSVVSGVHNSVVEALEELRINSQDHQQCPGHENDRFEFEPVIIVVPNPTITNKNQRRRSASF